MKIKYFICSPYDVSILLERCLRKSSVPNLIFPFFPWQIGTLKSYEKAL